jgi:hypothetical protein
MIVEAYRKSNPKLDEPWQNVAIVGDRFIGYRPDGGKEVFKWLDDNVSGQWKFTLNYYVPAPSADRYRQAILFTNERDAILFYVFWQSDGY